MRVISSRPIRRILRRQANSEVILGEAESIDRFARKVILSDGEIGYDYLIIASGATHSYFGHDAWERDAPGLKTLEEALEIRRRVRRGRSSPACPCRCNQTAPKTRPESHASHFARRVVLPA